MADVCTTNISNFINRMGINISALSRETGISDGILRRSVVRRERDLRSDEFMAICKFLKRDPFEFYQARAETDARNSTKSATAEAGAGEERKGGL